MVKSSMWEILIMKSQLSNLQK
ncbi:hypothetical protein ACMD2_18202 [Ananas comosus]|uniref:Uncharacterized protein n=1 Tax=Ananas comosus TaxID=4615 RepID=A0A199VRP7_ANACO|nr:hypothetical protein ACMD2_18202 [Ananas comosus]